ncbi:hypothetical protein AX16_003682 [Volvariella volvacea WC 439]|nr:hypothetical protein AX16_003682 [Volvariella volvacea WC 439]
MSLRIKVPAKGGDAGESQTDRRRPAKRRKTIESEEEEAQFSDDKDRSVSPPEHRSRAKYSKRIKDHGTDSEGGGNNDEYDSDARSNTAPSQSRSTARRRSEREGPPVTKKKRYIVSESGSDQDYDDEDRRSGPADEGTFIDDDGEEDYVQEKKKKAGTASSKSSSAKGKGGSAAGKAGASKGKGKARTMSDNPDVPMKDERGASKTDSTGLKRSRTGTSKASTEDLVVDVVNGDPAVITESPTAATKEESPPPKKRKLPTIKKNKLPGSSVPSSSSTAPAPAVAPRPAPPKPQPTVPESSLSIAAIPRKPTGGPLHGNTDVDLRNANVYAELFKGSGGAPRSGLNRREKDEERRRELNKMRDEARAKREADAKDSFDLTAQFDRILKFEERLRRDRSSALYPNFLAGKWRDLYEREKSRKKRELDNSQREEGEMES